MKSGGTNPRRPGGDGVGGLLRGLGDLITLAERLAEQGEQAPTGEREFTSPGGLRGVYGFSVRTGIGGTPTVERFGNVRDTTEGPVVSDTREPLVDVFDEGEEIVVVAEVPGVQEKDIHLEVNGDVLALSATGPKRTVREGDPSPRGGRSGGIQAELSERLPGVAFHQDAGSGLRTSPWPARRYATNRPR